MSKIQNQEDVNVSVETETLTPTPETPVVPTTEEDEFTPVGELPKVDEVVPTAPEALVVPEVTPEVTAQKAGKEAKEPKAEKAPKTPAAPTAPKAGKSDLVKIKFKIEVGYKTKKHSAGDEAEFTETELADFMPTWYTVL